MPKGLTVVLNQPGKPLELETLPTPEVEPGGILIKNTAAAICGSDLHYWRNDGNYSGPDLRRVPGHEFTGVVAQPRQGRHDRFAAAAAEGRRSGRVSVLQPVQSLLLVRPRRASRLPAPPAPEHAVHPERVPVLRRRLRRVLLPAARPLRLQGAGHAARRRDSAGELRACARCSTASSTAEMKFGDVVVIQGAGGLGIYAAAIAAEKGASKVISIDKQPLRLDFAQAVRRDRRDRHERVPDAGGARAAREGSHRRARRRRRGGGGRHRRGDGRGARHGPASAASSSTSATSFRSR